VTDMATAARALLDADLSRGELKRRAADLDKDLALRQSLVAEARRRGVELPEDATFWPSKVLLRRARDREAVAHVVGTPTHRDERFSCVVCGLDVPEHGRTARDHCPRCLSGLHVDVIPGDRASDCGGVLRAVGADGAGGRWRIRYRCDRCGSERWNQALLDGDVPDDWSRICAIAAGGT
jgi:hypothetical protein